MATFALLHDATDGAEVHVNVDHIISMRRYEGQNYTTLFFENSASQFGVTKRAADIARLAADVRKFG